MARPWRAFSPGLRSRRRAARLTEIDAVKALETFRRASAAMKDISFPTIAAAGPNSAIPHYRVSETSNRRIERGIFLVDSGAQYEDGTTDITRTIAVGRPTQPHARPVHARAQGPYRDRARGLSGGHERRPDRRAGADGALASGA